MATGVSTMFNRIRTWGKRNSLQYLLKVIQLPSVRFRLQMVNVVALKPDELWNFLPAHPDE